jgi:aryl-alcohol dehydrogenase-like predicted oxidoreductase
MSFGGQDPGSLTWSLRYEDSKRIIERSIDAGINFFDTADVYSAGKSEEILGRAIEGRRDDLIVATKVCSPMGPATSTCIRYIAGITKLPSMRCLPRSTAS